jgi:hydroxymethylpyrimidine/phosphomethylpyrimidine kinase
MSQPLVALTVAGSDSGAGAGLQADLKAFSALGVFATTVVSAVTAQNTAGVRGVWPLGPEAVEAQLAAVLEDFRLSAAKTGMLATADNVAVVARHAEAGELPNLVVDPVMVSSTGQRLLDAGAERAYLDLLVPQALVVTPNLREAALLSGRRIGSAAEMLEAADQLRHRTGAAFVLVKGGHLDGAPTDVLVGPDTAQVLSGSRVESANTHGSGCSLASALAAYLCLGHPVPEAARLAKRYVSRAIEGSRAWTLGSGHGPLDHFGWGTWTEGGRQGSATGKGG